MTVAELLSKVEYFDFINEYDELIALLKILEAVFKVKEQPLISKFEVPCIFIRFPVFLFSVKLHDLKISNP